MPDNEFTRRRSGDNGFLRNGHDGSGMIPELAAQYAARASGAAIRKTTIKRITLVLNRRTQRAALAILFPLADSRCAHARMAQRKTALPNGNAVPGGFEFANPKTANSRKPA